MTPESAFTPEQIDALRGDDLDHYLASRSQYLKPESAFRILQYLRRIDGGQTDRDHVRIRAWIRAHNHWPQQSA